MSNCLIYDFETLSVNTGRCAIVSFAMLKFDEDKFGNDEYSYEDLLSRVKYLKFDIKDQVSRGRDVSDDTLKWWNKIGMMDYIKPSESDVNLSQLHPFIISHIGFDKVDKVYNRGSTFDSVVFRGVCDEYGLRDPFEWWAYRDTRSMIEGMSFGSGIRHDFIPSEISGKYIKHNPKHDIVLDVFRMQYLVKELGL